MTDVTEMTEAQAATKPTPPEVAEAHAEKWANDYLARLAERTQSRLMLLANGSHGSPGAPSAPNGASATKAPTAAKPAMGEPTVGPYVAFDVAATSPIQFTGLPPYQPSKIIAAGEQAFIVAYMFVNPVADVQHGFAVPPTVQLGGRRWRLTLDQINLKTGQILAPQVRTGIFGSPAPSLTVQVFSLVTPNPGPDPALIEANITLDIVDPAQPYAAFVTSFFDVDDDPGFLFVPPAPHARGSRSEQLSRTAAAS